MHRCWLIPEMLQMICSHLPPGLSPNAMSAALAALARTSRVFQGPAIDILWRKQYTLLHFLKCMPSDLFSFRYVGPDRNVTVRLLRPILPSDWDRPLIYAHRVRHLVTETRISSLESFSSLSDVLAAMSMSLPNDSVFPNLEYLAWEKHPSADFHYIRFFLTPTITTLRLSCDFAPANLSILALLPRKCPALTDVTVNCGSSVGESMAASFTAFFDGLPLLENLNMDVSESAILTRIGRLERLTSLLLWELPAELPPPSAPDVPFLPNVRTIVLHDEFEKVAKFFRRCTVTFFNSITIEFPSKGKGPTRHKFFAALAACQHLHASLTTLHLTIDSESMSGPNPYTINSRAFRLLFCFRRLTSLDIATEDGVDLDDATVADMAQSFPDIERLHLTTYSNLMEPRCTLKGLQFLARHCPGLKSLQMTFDASTVPTFDGKGSQTTLTDLNVGFSPLTTALPVARFISGIFPGIQSLVTYRDLYFDEEEEAETEAQIASHHLWEEVRLQIPVVLAIREEGRTWPPRSPS
ncbi:hypothetical protein C8F04DRAFT_1123937, partial [Mycena alexandri]